ncbi:efflux RND transporter permease subunit [Desulfatiferula olefinivorans]
MNIARLSIEKKVVTLALTLAVLGAGILSYQGLSRLEDPEFTIKQALVVTSYPGGSPVEVEQEVTDKIEKAVQQMGQVDKVLSRSERGLSTVTVEIRDSYDRNSLPQVWDELRRKISDVQAALPPGAGPSKVIDDYGDVYGVFFAVTGDEYTDAELKETVKMLERELLLVRDVAKITVSGLRTEAVYIIPDRDRMAQLGLPLSQVVNALTAQNAVTDAGRVTVGSEWIALATTGSFSSVRQYEDLLIPRAGSGKDLYLKDIARVRRAYVEPPTHLMRYDGKRAIGLGLSTVSGGNVVTMGEAVKQRLAELTPMIPLGIAISPVSMQSDSVAKAISMFMTNLIEAVIIVIVVLMVFMGFQSAALIGFILFLTVIGTFIFMKPFGIALERISLGALIIALGMLVDNAIVVVDGILIRISRGTDKKTAAIETVNQTAWPLFGATVIAILAFAAIGTSQDSTGEFCRSLFQVVMFSLGLSWVTAVTVTPLLAVMFLKVPKNQGAPLYGSRFYTGYRRLLSLCIHHRWLSMGLVGVMFIAALWGFGSVKTSFFPDSTRPQFMIDFYLPQGTHIEETERQALKIEADLLDRAGVTHVTTLIGQGAPRFMLTYAPERANSSYVQFLVDVQDYRVIDHLIPEIKGHLTTMFPDGLARIRKMALGPGGSKIELRIAGPDGSVLRQVGDHVRRIIEATGQADAVRTDWRQKVKTVEVSPAEEQANLNGITRPDVSRLLRESFEGAVIGLFRDGDELLPVKVRAPGEERKDIASLNNLQIWSPHAGRMIPLRQVVQDIGIVFADDIIHRRNRLRTLTVSADPVEGVLTSDLQKQVMAPVSRIVLPPGYSLVWGGEYENSSKASAQLMQGMPLIALLMVVTLIALFNALREPLVIMLCVPLALIGVTVGLLVTHQPFGFMAILGFLSLSGMLIKNAIVLIDQVNADLAEGKTPYAAVMDSGVSRVRPVAMAALTTALGMVPLVFDAFFVSMSVTIISGLMFATLLTMFVVPVLYTLFFKVRIED